MMATAGLLSTALNEIKLMYAIGSPRNLGSKQKRVQKKKVLLFPDLQETVDASVVLEFMKIMQSNLAERFVQFGIGIGICFIHHVIDA
ncbi:hypothetical protein V6N12_025414 [Hibiscus sabdariffa]|uniref:Uncharacterized protein n=1 Tax=Hibiscus sabdariffa TaxID=183260 RepID=A0ABR2CIU1_9ROSI